MHRPRLRHAAPLAVLALLLATAGDAVPAPRDPAARGLDLFLHAPERAAPLATLPVQIEALGFPTVVAPEPLAGAALEAAWDPEQLGPGITAAPPPLQATTDAAGRAHLDVPVPDGDERDLVLLVGVRSGDHSRTRELKVHRARPHNVSLHVTDHNVVPGSTVSAWILVTSAITGEPIPGAPIDLDLLEGGVPHHEIHLTSDASGSAMARMPIPRIDEPAWSWNLVARTPGPQGHDSGSATLQLWPREETPGKPRLYATWDTPSVREGARAAYSVRVLDASGAPVAALPVRTWIGPKGTEPPSDDDGWIKASTPNRTSAGGDLTGSFLAPSTVGRAGTSLQLAVRTSVEGHALAGTAWIDVGDPEPTLELLPEAGAIAPGLEQRLLLRVLDGQRKPIHASFTLAADGLAESVTTDAFGEAEITWKTPVDLGAHHKIGACASGVAAVVVVKPQGIVPAFGARRDPFEPCVPVRRELTALVRPDAPIAHGGEKIHLRVTSTRPQKHPWSVVLRSDDGVQSTSAWIDDGDAGGEVTLPEGARGLWSITGASPGSDREAELAAGTILVVPRTLPLLSAAIGGGRIAPGGSVDVDADLSDGHGRGLPGTVAAVVFDSFGGGSALGLSGIDTRAVLCGLVSVDDDRCQALLEGDRSVDPLRRGLLGERERAPLAPASDPGGTAKKGMTEAFRDVVSSLEGAVFESTASADLLRDARRRAGATWTFNPELFTLVTGLMEPRPTTPGGEPLLLADLVVIDPQVTFDNVARRITRLKLFRILDKVREFRHELRLDPGEPALRDPNAFLRRMVAESKIDDEALLDPWGGTIQFTKSAGPALPFIAVIQGFELHSPGPDGVLGSADDVRDPLARVLKSKSPYAEAVGEDKIVDAKALLEVGDATVSAWGALLEGLTGTTLGHGGGTGTGEGFGSGHGRLGGSHRTKPPQVRMGSTSIDFGDAFFSYPVRTDDRGHVRIHVPLGDAETTWRVALIGIPDHAMPATATVDVPVAAPLSARVDAGARWVEGDVVDVAITVRNRTPNAVHAALAIEAAGVAAIVDVAGRTGTRDARVVDVAAGGSAQTTVRVQASAAGLARLGVKTSAPGVASDALDQSWEVIAPGEPTNAAHTLWVDGSADLSAWLAQGGPALGPPRLRLERGPQAALTAALESLDPDRLRSPDAMADAVEVASRVKAWAVARGGDRDPLALRADEIARRAVGRLAVYRSQLAPHRGTSSERRDELTWIATSRARALGAAEEVKLLGAPEACPPKSDPGLADVGGLDAEPPPVSGSTEACWTAFVTGAVAAVTQSHDPVALARAVLALADRPQHAATLEALVDRLRAEVKLEATGAITLPGGRERDRAARSTVFAALLRATRTAKPGPAPAGLLTAWALVQRDGEGGYGAPAATAAVVRALLGADGDAAAKTTVTVVTDGNRREVTIAPSGLSLLEVAPGTKELLLETKGPGVVVRFDRRVLRPWSRAPQQGESPVHVEVTWPVAKAGKIGVLRVALRHDLGRAATLDVRLPLPPGVSLAETVEGVRQIQGVLAIRRALDASGLTDTLELPLRFALAGAVTVPEGSARVAFEEAPRALLPARPLRVE